MNYSEVRVLWQELNSLCDYVSRKGIDDTVFNIFLNRNKKILKPLNEETDSWMPKELTALVDKIIATIKEEFGKSDYDSKGKTPFQVGFEGLSTKEQALYNKLDTEFITACAAEECYTSLYLYNPEKLDRINLDFIHTEILDKFLADDLTLDNYFTKKNVPIRNAPEAVSETPVIPILKGKLKK